MTKDFFHQHIFIWWREHGRVLPWRKKVRDKVQGARYKSSSPKEISVREATFQSYFAGGLKRDPYKVVVSEVMLQQTQVDRVIPKFEQWMKQWPTVENLAEAKLSDVLIAWRGLGYNRRARFLWLLAKEIVKRKENLTSSPVHGFDRAVPTSLKLSGAGWPKTEGELIKLPGIGKYTARALLSFCFGHQVAVVDTNVKRVLGRWVGVEKNFQLSIFNYQKNYKNVNSKFQNSLEIRNSKLEIGGRVKQRDLTEKDWFALADSFLPAGQADPWNQAMMDFGALVCTQKNPKCEVCPVANLCQVNLIAQKEGFKNYKELLNSERESKQKIVNRKQERKGKDKGLKFEQTDRFFRGRIIDIVRESSVSIDSLEQILHDQFQLQDTARFQQLLKNLQKEKLITITQGKVKLAES